MSLTIRQKQYNKAMRKVDSLVTKAIEERLQKGYRENLGYDSQNELENYINFLDSLTYSDKTEIVQAFYSACDKI